MEEGLPDISVVVIGRNEGKRLIRCFQSIQKINYPGDKIDLIYVDSASTDGSCEVAAGFGARVLQSDTRRPSAAAARNTGLRAARHRVIQFLDGDTIINPDWLRKGTAVLKDPQIACAFGHCQEMNPHQSVYMRVTAFNWYGPPGPARYCGGNALFKKDVLDQTGGFNETLIAGEEPELCHRIRKIGFIIWRCDEPMILHDLNMTRFRQYWQRAVRSGWAYCVIAVLCFSRTDPLWLRENLLNAGEVLLWTLLLLLGTLWQPWWGVVLVGLIGLRILWIARRVHFRADGWRSCLLYGVNCQVARIPMLIGQFYGLMYFLRNRSAKLMEYKE